MSKQSKKKTTAPARAPVSPAAPPAATPRAISDRMSGAEIGRISGLSRQRVSVLRKEGRSAGQIISTQEWKRRAAANPDGPPDGKHGKRETWLEARSRKESLLADLRQMEVARRRGELVERAEVDSYVVGAILSFRDSLLRLPSELRDRCDREPGPVIEQLFFGEMHRLLCDFSRNTKIDDAELQEFAEWRAGRHDSNGRNKKWSCCTEGERV